MVDTVSPAQSLCFSVSTLKLKHTETQKPEIAPDLQFLSFSY